MKLNSKSSLIFTIILTIAGLISLCFYKTNNNLGFLSCVFLGGGIVMFGRYVYFRYQTDLIQLDKNLTNKLKEATLAREFLDYNKDKVENFSAENLENFTYNEDDYIRDLRLFIKKNKKKHISFYFGGIALILTGFLLLL